MPLEDWDSSYADPFEEPVRTMYLKIRVPSSPPSYNHVFKIIVFVILNDMTHIEFDKNLHVCTNFKKRKMQS